MALIDAAVVGSDDENGVFGHSGIVDSLDDFAYVPIQLSKSLIVFGRAMTKGVTLVVGAVVDYAHESRLRAADVIDGSVGDATRIVLRSRDLLSEIECTHFDEILHTFPLIDITHLSIGISIAK